MQPVDAEVPQVVAVSVLTVRKIGGAAARRDVFGDFRISRGDVGAVGEAAGILPVMDAVGNGHNLSDDKMVTGQRVLFIGPHGDLRCHVSVGTHRVRRHPYLYLAPIVEEVSLGGDTIVEGCPVVEGRRRVGIDLLGVGRGQDGGYSRHVLRGCGSRKRDRQHKQTEPKRQ